MQRIIYSNSGNAGLLYEPSIHVSPGFQDIGVDVYVSAVSTLWQLTTNHQRCLEDDFLHVDERSLRGLNNTCLEVLNSYHDMLSAHFNPVLTCYAKKGSIYTIVMVIPTWYLPQNATDNAKYEQY